jgi:hypothetical protein
VFCEKFIHLRDRRVSYMGKNGIDTGKGGTRRGL